MIFTLKVKFHNIGTIKLFEDNKREEKTFTPYLVQDMVALLAVKSMKVLI